MTDKVTESIIVKGDVHDVYSLWADFSNFPQFMKDIESVTLTGDDESHWVMKGPAKTSFEWVAITTRREEDSRIAWKSVDGDLKVNGQVTFKELPQDEVQITATVQYVPPRGAIGSAVAKLFGNPDERLRNDLRSFKMFFEQSLKSVRDLADASQQHNDADVS